LIRQTLILSLFFLFLTGCAQKITKQTTLYADWKTRLASQQTWQIKGKLAFISPDERQSANLNWQQRTNKNQLLLTSFIGTQVLALTQTNEGAVLEFDNQIYQEPDAQHLLRNLTGLTLPVKQADNWLKGTIETHSLHVDELGRAISVEWYDEAEIKWQINYTDYIQSHGFWLPSKLTLKHQQIKIKIQIYDWQFN
jgi:outer membrane lipoprotein LolB